MDASTDTVAAEIARRGFERLLLFTDGVVAVPVTLLILPVVDDVLRSDPHVTTLALLRQLENELFGFGLSFAVIVVLWLGHQRVFARVAAPTPALVWLNIGWLLTIILLPCSTAL